MREAVGWYASVSRQADDSVRWLHMLHSSYVKESIGSGRGRRDFSVCQLVFVRQALLFWHARHKYAAMDASFEKQDPVHVESMHVTRVVKDGSAALSKDSATRSSEPWLRKLSFYF